MGLFDTIIDLAGHDHQTKWQRADRAGWDQYAYETWVGFNTYRLGDESPAPDGDYEGIVVHPTNKIDPDGPFGPIRIQRFVKSVVRVRDGAIVGVEEIPGTEEEI